MSDAHTIENKFALSLILAIGFALRVCGISFRSFYADEVFVIRAIQKPFSSLFAIDAPHGGLPFYILHFWSKIFGYSEFWIRFPSVLFGVLTCYFIYKIAMELTNKRIALIAATIASVSPFLILYDQTARWYSLFGLIGTISVYFFLKNMKYGKNIDLFLFSMFNLLLLYIEPTAIFVMGFEAVAAVLLFRKWSVKLTSSFLADFVLYIPIVIASLNLSSFQRFLPGTFVERGVSGGLVYKIFYVFYSFSIGQTISPFILGITIPATTLFLLLFLFGVKRGASKYKTAVPFLLLYLGISLVQVLTQVNLPHYMMHAMAPFVIIVSVGISELSRKRYAVAVIIAIMVLYGYSLHNMFTEKQYNRMEFTDHWKDVAVYVKENSAKEDLVIHSSDSFDYYCKDRRKTVYGNDLPGIKASVMKYFSARPSGRIVLVYSPLSGLFASEAGTGLALENWMSKKYAAIAKRPFDRDPDYQMKRKFVKRVFPEYRIYVSVYSQKPLK